MDTSKTRKKILAFVFSWVLILAMVVAGGNVYAEGNGEAQNSGLLQTASFAKGTTATAEAYQLSPEFKSDVHEYEMYVPDDASMVAVKATLADTAKGGTIKAKYKNTSGTERTTNITSGKATGTNLVSVIKAGGVSGNTITLEVTAGDVTENYQFTVKFQRSLSALKVMANGRQAKLTPDFSRYGDDQYKASVSSETEKVTLAFTKPDAKYDVEVDGQKVEENEAVVLFGEEKTKTVKITAKYSDEDNSSAKTYTLQLEKKAAVKVALKGSPEDIIINLKDSLGNTYYKNADGTYSLMDGEEYSYTATKYGYIAQTGTITAEAGLTKEITLEKAPANTTINPGIKAEWKNFRNSDYNMGITNANTPITKEGTNLRWAQIYGSGWANAPCVQIVVNGKVLSIVNNRLVQLDPATGNVEKEMTLVAATNWGYTPMTYADGIIFCPLQNGTVQAVNADTFESLWVYHDPLKGQSLSPNHIQ